MAAAHRLALDIAADAGVLVAVDLNLRIHLWPSADGARDAAGLLLARARVLKGSLHEVNVLVAESDPLAAARALLQRAPELELACVTLGEEGAVWAHRSGTGGRVRTPDVVEVKDTTGAGDAFTAALVAGWLQAGGPAGSVDGEIAGAIVQRAVLAGTRSVSFVGATTGMPTRGELDQLVAQAVDF